MQTLPIIPIVPSKLLYKNPPTIFIIRHPLPKIFLYPLPPPPPPPTSLMNQEPWPRGAARRRCRLFFEPRTNTTDTIVMTHTPTKRAAYACCCSSRRHFSCHNMGQEATTTREQRLCKRLAGHFYAITWDYATCKQWTIWHYLIFIRESQEIHKNDKAKSHQFSTNIPSDM